MKVLVTGFEPFGGESINPALEAVKRLEEKIVGAKIIKAEIPTVFKKSIEKLLKIIEQERPDITLCIGQAGGRSELSVERVAINIVDARIPDNAGNQPIDESIYPDGETAYFTNLPIKAMVKEIKGNKIPASVSNSAGTFVCNYIMYGLLYVIDKKYPEMRGGFIHVPYIPEQTLDKNNTPSMSLNNITKGLKLAIKATVENDKDIKKMGGTIC